MIPLKKDWSMFKTFSLRKLDFFLILASIALSLIGVAAIGSAAPALRGRQLMGVLAGVVIMLAVSTQDYSGILNLYWLMYIVNIILLLLVLFIGTEHDDARRWVQLGPITFQPSELAKLLLILFFSQFIMKYKEHMKSILMLGILSGLILVPVYLIYKEPDLSTDIVVILIFAALIFLGGISIRLVIGFFVISIPALIIFLNLVLQEGQTILKSYQRDRILAYFHPEDYPDKAYQTLNSIMAIGSGQLLGKGYNTNEISSLLNSGYISESQTDFIFTVIGEEFGFVGSCAVVLLIAFICTSCFITARKAKDTAGMLAAAGIGAWVGFQGIINMGVTTGIIPNTGLPLPFVSYGLTSLLSLFIGLGIVLNIRMQTVKPRSAVTFRRSGA